MATTLETCEPLTEGTHGRHGSEPVNDADEHSELETLAALLAQTRAYRTMPIFSDAALEAASECPAGRPT